MKNIFGVSFSGKAMDIAHAVSEETIRVISLKSVAYPFPFHYDTLFAEESIDSLASFINAHKLEKGLEELDLVVSLPQNFTFFKRIAVPLEAEADLIKAQVEWELSQYLRGSIADYKVIKKDETLLDTYKEILFLVIKKDIFSGLSRLAQASHTQLAGIKTDSDSLLNILKKYYSAEEGENQFVIRTDGNIVNTHLYISGRYYQSFFDETDGSPDGLLDVCRERLDLAKEITDTLSSSGKKEYKIYLHTPNGETSFAELLKEQCAQDVVLLDVQEAGSGSPEALGAIL